jgi:phage-related protein
MATLGFAIWLQQAELAVTNRLIMIFIGLIAVAVLALAIALIAIAVKAMKMVKDLTVAAEDFKTKMMPLLEVATDVGRTSRDLLQDSAPKLKIITANLVETSETLKATSRTAQSVAEHCDATVTDVNLRAQRQVARVDDMVTVALTTTSEVVGAIANGLKGPAQRVAAMAGQAKNFAEGLFARFRTRASAARGSEMQDEPTGDDDPPFA